MLDTEGQLLYEDLHEDSKIAKIIEAESWAKSDCQRLGAERKGNISQRAQSFSFAKWINPRDIPYYTTGPIVKNTI